MNAESEGMVRDIGREQFLPRVALVAALENRRATGVSDNTGDCLMTLREIEQSN